jgi:hypothetical protein
MAAVEIFFLSKQGMFIDIVRFPFCDRNRKGDALQSIIKTTIVLDLFMSLFQGAAGMVNV